MYSVKEISSKEALDAWTKTDEASLFCNPEYLKIMNHEVIYLGGFKNNELLAVWPFLRNEMKNNSPPPYSYYFGPFSTYKYYSLPPYKAFKNHLEIYSCLIEEVLRRNEFINFSLSPDFFDLRPFQWWNYNESNKKHFQINIKYTAQYNLSNFNNEEQLLLTFRPDDKRKKFKKLNSRGEFYTDIDKEFNPSFLSELYKETINNSGGIISIEELYYLEALMNLTTENFVSPIKTSVVLLKSKVNDEVHGFQLLLIGKSKSYAVAQAVTNFARSKSASILLTASSIKYTKTLGCKYFDFNGANSPMRGDDKHSFGAQAYSYMELSLI